MQIIRAIVSSNFRSTFLFYKIGGCPYSWDPQEKRFTPSLTNPQRSSYWRLTLMLFIFSVYTYDGAILNHKDIELNKGTQIAEYSQTLMVAGILALGIFIYKEQARSSDSEMAFFNELLWSEERHCSGYSLSNQTLRKKSKIVEFSLRYLEVVVIRSIPFIIGVGSAPFPSNPLNLLRGFKIPETVPSVITFFLSFVLYGACNVLVWGAVVRIGCRLIAEFMVSLLYFPYMLYVFERRVLEVTKADNSSIRRGPLVPQRDLLLLRETQILLREFNNLFVGKLMVLQLVSSLAFISSMYSLTKLGELPVSFRFVFPVFVLDSIIIFFMVYGYAGDVYFESEGLRERLRCNHYLIQSAIFRKFLRSCPALRIKFGFTNFIEKTTPLLYIHFCFCRLLDLLLIE